MKISKPWLSKKEFEEITGGTWTPAAHTHEWVDITDFATYLDQAVKQASSPTFVTAKLTALTNGYVPYHVSDALGLANSPIFIDGTKVGIGTASLGAKLHINDMDRNTGLYLQGDQPGLLFHKDKAGETVTKWNIFTHITDDYLAFYEETPSAGYRMVILSGGNVGIGKVPTCELDVNGTIKATEFYLNLGGLLDVTLGSLEEGETIRYDQATTKWIDAWGIDYDNPRLVYKFYTDFFSTAVDTNDPWIGAALGTGTKTAIAGTSNHPGIVRFTSSATIGHGYRFMTAVNCILIAGAEHSEFCFKTPGVLTNVRVRLGFQDSLTSTAPTDGVYIDINGTTLTGKTRSNGAESTTGAADPLVVSTWYRAKIAVNSDATLVTFVLYSAAGNQLWSQTLAANIPTAAGRETGHGAVAWVGANVGRALIDLDMMIATRAGYITR